MTLKTNQNEFAALPQNTFAEALMSILNAVIAGNFRGRNFHELMANKIFAEKTFADYSLVPHKDITPPNL